MFMRSNLDTKCINKDTISWDDYTSLIHNKNYQTDKLLILIVFILLIFSSYGLFLLLPLKRVSVYSMQINDPEYGNFLMIKQTDLPAESFNLDHYINANIQEK